MDYLASSHFTYRPVGGKDQPLFLSVTSEADLATRLLLKVGHAVPLLGYKLNGSLRAKPSCPCHPMTEALVTMPEHVLIRIFPTIPVIPRTARDGSISPKPTTSWPPPRTPGALSHEITIPATSILPGTDPQCLLQPRRRPHLRLMLHRATDFFHHPGRRSMQRHPILGYSDQEGDRARSWTIFTKRFIEFLKPFIQNVVRLHPCSLNSACRLPRRRRKNDPSAPARPEGQIPAASRRHHA